jgi:hypothetical protein
MSWQRLVGLAVTSIGFAAGGAPAPAAGASTRATRARQRWSRSRRLRRWRRRTWAGAHRARGAPRRLVAPTNRAIEGLARAVRARQRRKAREAALDVTQATLDLRLRYRPPAEIDRARFRLWARRVPVDAAARDRAAVGGDVATLEWIRDRFARALDSVTLTRVDTLLERLRGNVADGDLAAAARTAVALRRALA